MTFVAGASSLVGFLLAFALGFFEEAAGAGAGSGSGTLDGFPGSDALDGFTGGCLLFSLVLFSSGAFDAPPNKLSKSTGFAEVLLARGRTGAGGGVGTIITRGAFGALLARGFTGGGGVGGRGAGSISSFFVALLDRDFPGARAGVSMLLVLGLAGSGFSASTMT